MVAESEARMSSGKLPETYEGPGLVDLQLNGYAGFDFNAPDAAWPPELFTAIRDTLRRRGVVAALPTFITDDAERIIGRAQAYAAALARRPELERTFPGLHIEGPFISADDGPRGAHPKAFCRTPQDLPGLFDRLREASGDRIAIVTLAPELDGALELISRATDAGSRIALGHTRASRSRLLEAADRGATLSTHLGNGSHLVLPRLDNYVQAQLADDRLLASFVADGHHMPFFTLKNFIRAKTPVRSILITDAIAAADVGPGEYELAGQTVVVSPDLRVQKPGESNLAGSALTLDRAVVNVALHCGVLFADAWEMASARPARYIGYPHADRIEVSVGPGGFRLITEA